jgi:AcrR family transcriptional regulator
VATAQSRRRLGANARRESILEVALTEFAASGYERTRVAEIASRVGVTEPVVFQNFGTKADLFAAVLERAADQLAAHLDVLGRETASVVDLLRRLLAPAHQNRMHRRGGLGVLFIEASASSDPKLRRALQRAHTRAAKSIAGLLGRGQVEGSVRADVDPIALAWLVLSEIHAGQFRRAHGKSSLALEDEVLHSFVEEIAPRRTRSADLGQVRDPHHTEGKPGQRC